MSVEKNKLTNLPSEIGGLTNLKELESRVVKNDDLNNDDYAY